MSTTIALGRPLVDEPLCHCVEYGRGVQHDGMPGPGNEFEVGLWQGSLHLTLLHQAHQAVSHAVHQ